MALIRAVSLDRTQADQVNSFNDLLNEITEFYFSGSKKPKKTWKEQAKVLEDFTKFKGNKIKLNNFKKVK
jgi:hypothetical protein